MNAQLLFAFPQMCERPLGTPRLLENKMTAPLILGDMLSGSRNFA